MKTAAINTVSHSFHPVSSLSARLANWFRRGRAIDTLNGLSDRHLRDIGVARGDIETVIDREIGRYRIR